MEFTRFQKLIGDSFEKIQKLRVLVIGIGGVGGIVVESLARSGVENITIVDHDVVDITNINRQIVALHSTIGRLKVDVLKERILDINPNCQVKTYNIFYEDSNKDIIFSNEYDYIVDCCDSIKSKESIIREAVKRNIKIISSMGAGFKLDPSKIKIGKLKNTSYDKLAKKLRTLLRDDNKCINIPVVSSTEFVSKAEKPIASNAYIPNMFGLMITSYIIQDVLDSN